MQTNKKKEASKLFYEFMNEWHTLGDPFLITSCAIINFLKLAMERGKKLHLVNLANLNQSCQYETFYINLNSVGKKK